LSAKTKTVISTVLFFICSILTIFIFIHKDELTFAPWRTTIQLRYATGAAGNDQCTALITNSGSSVVVINKSGDLLYDLNAKQDDDRSFGQVKFIDVDNDNNIYVLDSHFAAQNQENIERVLQYSPEGLFLKEVFSYRYINVDFILTKGKTAGMSCQNGNLYLVFLEENVLLIKVINLSGFAETTIEIAYPHCFIDVEYVDINASGEQEILTLTTKAGAVKQLNSAGDLLFELPPSGGMNRPWNAVSDGSNGIIYTDILARRIYYLDANFAIADPSTDRGAILYAPETASSSAYFTLKLSGEKLFASPFNENGNIMVMDHVDGEKEISYIESYQFSEQQITLGYVLFIAFILDLVVVAFLVGFLIIFLLKRKRSEMTKNIITVCFCLFFGAAIPSLLIINEMTTRYNEKSFNSLENITLLTASAIDAKIFDEFKNPSDWESLDYKNFMNKLDSQFAKLRSDGKRVYQVIWKTQDNKLYLIYETEKSWGMFFPLPKYGDSSYHDAEYLDRFANVSEFLREDDVTPDGSWRSVSLPLFDENHKITAFIETGYDISEIKKENEASLTKTLFSIWAILFFILLLIVSGMVIYYKAIKEKKGI
jgi:hypothetical protein